MGNRRFIGFLWGLLHRLKISIFPANKKSWSSCLLVPFAHFLAAEKAPPYDKPRNKFFNGNFLNTHKIRLNGNPLKNLLQQKPNFPT